MRQIFWNELFSWIALKVVMVEKGMHFKCYVQSEVAWSPVYWGTYSSDREVNTHRYLMVYLRV